MTRLFMRHGCIMKTVVWTEYLKYRAELRGFDLNNLEEVLRFSDERYYDSTTGRMIAIGKDGQKLVMIPYEETREDEITPVTIHATNRKQINYRIRSGRLINE